MRIYQRDVNGNLQTPNDYSRVTDSLQALGMAGTTSQDFIKAAVVEHALTLADAEYLKSQQDITTAITVQNALAQRDTQWASEQTMFLSVSKALMAFFEGFVYAITPIMGFLILIGAYGLGLLGKYCMVIVWIQLWQPCMSICNLYTLTGARNALGSIIANNGTSFYALNDSFNTISHWVATGGMLMAATPMLALFVVSGSMYAFTTLASRLNGADHFNEKNIAPDAMQVGAVQSIAPMSQFNRMQGALATGAEKIMPSLSEMTGITNNVSDKQANLDAATHQLSSAIARNSSELLSTAEGRQILQKAGESFGASRLSTGQTVREFAEQNGLLRGMSVQEQNQVLGQTAMALKGGGSVGAGGSILKALKAHGEVGGSISGTASSTDTATTGESFSRDSSSTNAARQSKGLSASAEKAVQTAIESSSSVSWQKALSNTKSQELRDAYSRTLTAQKEYSVAKSH